MDGRAPITGARMTILALLSLLLAACQPFQLIFNLPLEDEFIAGKVLLAAEAAQFSACSDKSVSLYAIGPDGKKDAKIAEAAVADDGSYKFEHLSAYGIHLDELAHSTKYLVEFACGDDVFRRFVTGSNGQDLFYGTTLFAWLGQTSIGHLVSQKNSSAWNEFFNAARSAESVLDAYTLLFSDSNHRTRFIVLFGTEPDVLKEAAPELRSADVPKNLKEGVTEELSVQAAHWWPDYPFAYEWRVGAKVLARAASFHYKPEANSQGEHSLQVFVGSDKGGGEVDLDKPLAESAFDIAIENTVPASSPPLVLVSSSVTNSTSVQLKILTGPEVDGRAQNCESFSKLALVEEAFPATGLAPVVPSAYVIDCTDTPEQDLGFSLSGVEGVRVLRLWVMDAAGFTSVAPSEVSVVYDKTPPQIDVLAPMANERVKTGATYTIRWTTNEPNAKVDSVAIDYSADDGSTWTELASSLPDTGEYEWAVPINEVTQARIRIRVEDLAENTGEAVSAPFIIDGTPPEPPVVTLASDDPSNNRTVQIALVCDSDIAKVYFSESATPPDSDSAGWTDCEALMSFDVSAGDGLKTIYAWAQDHVGHVSEISSSVSMTLDQTPPVIVLTSLNSGVYRAGSDEIVTWTITDPHLGSVTLDIDFSSDGGETWMLLAQGVPNTGSQQVTLPLINTSQARIRVRGCDMLNNCGEAMSAGDFVVDHNPPVLKSVVINDGETVTNSSLLRIKIDIDTETEYGPVRVLIKEAAAMTGDCQSEFVDSGWLGWTDASQVFLLPTAPIDGEKKVCVWAKDQFDHISVIDPGQGTEGVNSASITFEAGHLPEIVVFAAEGPGGERNVQAGDPITITWEVHDIEGLQDKPISFAYTTDNETWKDIDTHASIEDPSNITWKGSLTPSDKQAAGTFTWQAPTSGYFKLRAVARDSTDNHSLAANSNTFNTDSWSIYMGSRDRGDGGVGRSASLFVDPAGWTYAIDPKTGDIYAVDEEYGIRKWDAATGKVSTFIKHGTTNIVDGQPLNASSRMNVNHLMSLLFDSKGNLLISADTGNNAAKVYRVDLATKVVTHYAGGGTAHDGGYSAHQVSIVSGLGIAIDEEDSLYFFSSCDGTFDEWSSALNILKIPRNPDGTAGTSEKIMGNCTRNNVTGWGQPAVNASVGSIDYPYLSGIAAWDKGNVIYVAVYGDVDYKIINGILYQANLPDFYRTKWILYNRDDGYLYTSNNVGGVTKVKPNLSGANGETHEIVFRGDADGPGCTEDGVSINAWCGFVDIPIAIVSGNIFFAHGAQSNGGSAYSIKVWDRTQKLRTVFGSNPFFGEGKNRLLARGNFSGIYYKKATEGNQVAFPAGLYFTEIDGLVLGYVDPNTDNVSVVWGNQVRKENLSLQTGTVISKDVSMGRPYWGGSGHPLTFDLSGLPWLRVDHSAVRINADMTVSVFANGSMYLSDVPDGWSPNSATLLVMGGYHNFTLKGNTLFAIGAFPDGWNDPIVAIRALDFVGNIVSTVIGGSYTYNGGGDTLTGAPDNGTPGSVKDLPLWRECGPGGECFLRYDPATDRLYFSEQTKLRYIEKPTDPLQSTLHTVFSSPFNIRNFILKEDGSQIWYFSDGEHLICYSLESPAKPWCDGMTDHFEQRFEMGVWGVGLRPNSMTWMDDETLLISTKSGEILRYDLPQ